MISIDKVYVLSAPVAILFASKEFIRKRALPSSFFPGFAASGNIRSFKRCTGTNHANSPQQPLFNLEICVQDPVSIWEILQLTYTDLCVF